MLAVDNLHVGYNPGLHILRGVSIMVPAGRATAVLGANGVGKSTLLKAVFGMLKPEQGRILLDNADITGTLPHRMIDLGIAYGPQQPGIFSEMTVEENVALGGWRFRRDKRRMRAKLEQNYSRFPMLKDRRTSPAGVLSGGQRRMVELARVLMSDPRYLLIDEPSAGVAPIAADGVYATLKSLRDDGVGIVLVDQDITRALSIADYVYIIDLGQNRREGTPTQLGDIVSAFWSG
jgi:branched-chain amino acid transport system ATP-binding protein